MRNFQFGFLCVASLLVGVVPTHIYAAKPPVKKKPINSVATPLKGIKFVEAKTLTKTGSVIIPRQDGLVPQLLVDLLRDEEIIRIYPRCTFAVIDGYPVWSWGATTNSGIVEKKGEALRVRLVDRLQKLGFTPLPGIPNSIPRTQRGDRAFKYRKAGQRRELTVEFGGLVRWIGARRPSIGINIVCIIRGTKTIATPKLSDVISAVPTIAPPSHGRQPIPPAILKLLLLLPVTRVSLSGTNTTWYSLTVITPQSSLNKFHLKERLEAQLISAKFQKSRLPGNAREKKTDQLLHYVKFQGRSSNCRVRMDKTDGGCRIHLYVQP